MNVNDMVAALAAKTVDAMVNVEPYNAIAEADGIANRSSDFSSVDKLPVFMAATPDFVDKNPDTVVAYLQGLARCREDFKEQPNKVADVIYSFYTSKGYKMSPDTFAKALGARRGQSRLPADLERLHAGAAAGAAARRRRSPRSRTGRRRCVPTFWRRRGWLEDPAALT